MEHAHRSQGDGSFTCPMHPEISRDKPGMCPECGMNLIKVESAKIKDQNSAQKIRDKHEGHSTVMFLRKFWVSLILTVPVVLYSEVARDVLGVRLPSLEIGNWELAMLIPAVLGSVVFFYGGWVFLAGAFREIRGRLPGMMTLIGIAVSAAYVWSVYAVFAGAETLFWELTTLITIMLLG